MVLKLNPANPPVWRNLTDVQFGYGDKALILPNAGESERRLLGMLQRGIADGQLEYFATEAGMTSSQAVGLIDRIRPALSHQPDYPKATNRSLADRSAELEFIQFSKNSSAEILRAEADYRVQGAAILAQRSSRSIYLDSLGKTGLALVRGFAASGIGRLVTHDSRPILPADIGTDGYEQSQQNNSRLSAASNILSRNHLPARVSNANRMSNSSLDRLDFAVLVSQSVIAPTRYEIWARKMIPHLNLTFGERYIDVTPVLVPGKNPCLRCLDLNRVANDSAWPALASQALASGLRYDDAASRYFAAGLAIRSALAYLDDPGALGAALADSKNSGSLFLATKRGFRLDLAEHRVYEFDWPAAISCGCLSEEG